MIEALLDALALKELDRAGWVRAGVQRPESVAAHAWGVGWLVLVLLPPELDRERALTYAILHDLAEAWVGDITPHDGIDPADKHARERAAMASLCQRLARPDLFDLWAAYEAQADPESRFVRQLDRLDMALQARRYASPPDPAAPPDALAPFHRSAAAAIEHPLLRALLARLQPSAPLEPTSPADSPARLSTDPEPG